MTKRIIGLALAALLVLGAGGVAFAAASPERPSYGLDEAALALAADPAPQPGAAPAAAKRDELRACVKARVDAGGQRGAARKECADQLGIKPGGGRPGKPGKGGPAARLGRAAHADLIVPKQGAEGEWETIQVDRGKVTAASADSISLQRPDGPTVTLKVVPGTKVKGAATVAELAAGREVVAVSAGGEARSVAARA